MAARKLNGHLETQNILKILNGDTELTYLYVKFSQFAVNWHHISKTELNLTEWMYISKEQLLLLAHKV